MSKTLAIVLWIAFALYCAGAVFVVWFRNRVKIKQYFTKRKENKKK